MRLFVAIDLPENVRDYLYDLQSEIKKSGYAKINWIFKKNFHLTIKFLGEVTEDKIEELKIKLRSIKYNKFKVRLTNMGFYPNESRINVIWVGVEPADKVIELQKIVDSETLNFGDFKSGAHITLGRVKIIKNKKQFKEIISNIKIEDLDFEVNSFILFKSLLSKNGPDYTALERYELA